MNVTLRQRLIVLDAVIATMVILSWMILVPGDTRTSVALPEWSRFESNPSVLTQWQNESKKNSFDPTYIDDEDVVRQLVQDYPTAYFAETKPTRNFNGGSQAVVTWVILINNQFVTYTFEPVFKEPTLKAVNPTIKDSILHYQLEFDFWGMIIGGFLVMILPIYIGIILVYFFHHHNKYQAQLRTYPTLNTRINNR